MKKTATIVTLFSALATWSGVAPATAFFSDGSDGAFAPTSNVTFDLSTQGDNGVFNFTTIDIPENVTVRFISNADSPAVVFGATGDVNIAGQIVLSAFKSTGGPGGGEGGSGGNGTIKLPTDGTGVSPGLAGTPGVGQRGGAGGGGGNATAGGTATSRTGSGFGAGGSMATPPSTIAGGSGGGGGGGGVFVGSVQTSGGYGGGGGGGLQISTPNGSINLSGSLISDGAHGKYGYILNGAPGGGGSGGNFELNADRINLDPTATIRAIGGAGGGLSSEPVAFDYYYYSSHANGGLGYAVFDGTVNVAGADIFAMPTGIDLPGFSVDNPLLPGGGGAGGGSWTFDPINVLPTSFGGLGGPSLWIDPEVAVGYDYAVADARFASIELPSGFGDDVYEIWLINPLTGSYEFVQDLAAGVLLDLTGLDPFGTGALGQSIDNLRVLGIEVSELLDPLDSTAFPTGLTFVPVPGDSYSSVLTANLTMSALSETVESGGSSVPLPGTLFLLSAGLLGMVFGELKPGIALSRNSHTAPGLTRVSAVLAAVFGG